MVNDTKLVYPKEDNNNNIYLFIFKNNDHGVGVSIVMVI